MRSRSRFLAPGVLLASSVVLAVSAVLWLRPDAAVTASDSPQADGLPPGSAAMRVTLDPEGGGLQVMAGEHDLVLDPETLEALRRDTDGLTPVVHPDGSVSLHLQGRFQSASVARIDGDGTVVICSEHADDATAVLEGRIAPAEVQ